MITNAFSVTAMAACPILPPVPIREPRNSPTDRRQPSRTTDILTIGLQPALAVYLSRLFQQSWWTLTGAHTCADGVSFVRGNRTAVAVCEEVLPDGSWQDAAVALNSVTDAPALVVIGDNPALVQDVPALGGFDSLVRPLREIDVLWTIASAWHAWMNRFEAGGNGAPSCSGA